MSSDVSRELVSRVVALEQRLQRLEAVELGPQGGARLFNIAGQPFANGVWTACIYDTVIQDTRGFWSPGNPTRFTADRDGTWSCSMSIQLPRGGGVGNRFYAAIRVNGVNWEYMQQNQDNPAAASVLTAVSGEVVLTAGNFVEFWAVQHSGAPQITASAAPPNMHHHSAAFYQIL